MRFFLFSILLMTLILLSSNCNQGDTNYSHQQLAKKRKKRQHASLSILAALPNKVKSPKTNPTSSAKVQLGKLLFYDPILSGDKDVACATCHHPQNGYAEFRDLSIGVNGVGLGNKRAFNQPNTIPIVKRNAHTILNTAFNGINIRNQYVPENAPMFWDVRTLSLENQAIEPIKTLEEMRGTHFSEEEILVEVDRRIQEIPEYQTLFISAFDENNPITISNIGKAIAAFERSLVTSNTRFDRYMRGEEDAISLSEKDGFELFKKVGCANCHNGAMFSDFKTHIIGVPPNEKLPELDKGFKEQFAFRTASLRNLRFTAPYMHNGSLKTLKEVLEFYEDVSVGKIRNSHVPSERYDPLIEDVTIKIKDMSPIISFLNTLNDSDFDKTIPDEVPSGLSVGGNIQ